jgi:hypothetical protein
LDKEDVTKNEVYNIDDSVVEISENRQEFKKTKQNNFIVGAFPD